MSSKPAEIMFLAVGRSISTEDVVATTVEAAGLGKLSVVGLTTSSRSIAIAIAIAIATTATAIVATAANHLSLQALIHDALG